VVRVGRLREFVRAAAGIRRMRVKLASRRFPLGEWLVARRGVSRVTVSLDGAELALIGGELEAAALVRDLLTAGAAVYDVEEVSEGL